MCGIYGIIPGRETKLKNLEIFKIFERLAVLSESRGKESAGAVIYDADNKVMDSIKGPISASEFLKSDQYRKVLEKYKNSKISAIIGHSRLVTNGTQLKDFNNQPIIKDGLIGIHNGIIVNEKDIWERYSDLQREFQVDTEAMLALLSRNYRETNNLLKAVKNTFREIKGTVSTAIVSNYSNKFLLFTNIGSIYYLINLSNGLIVFASERHFIDKLVVEFKNYKYFGDYTCMHLKPNKGIISDFSKNEFLEIDINDFDTNDFKDESSLSEDVKIEETIIKNDISDLKDSVIEGMFTISNDESKILEYNIGEINQLKRCVKCLLPETFPFIEFDKSGVCNICNNYTRKNQTKPISDLLELIEPYRRKNEPDCIIPFSGGRDSSYTVHFAKKELGLNPITFTYDWGMVTDLARRNIARVCGKLGIENIIVSADIRKKREYIRKNILAWLKNPQLGMVPLFMAGDKFFYYYTKKLKQQTSIDLNIWGINNLENTDFKVGFCGVKLNFNKKNNYALKTTAKIQLFKFVAQNILSNPSYLNESNLDSIGSFVSRYFYPQKDYYHLFDFVKWNENEIENVILNEYDWEIANDTKSTWRIGDGTAGFYNYIYFNIAGFSEHETFRSNQIREGMLTREEGLKLIESENMPRQETIKWYLSIVGLDYMETIKTINKIPKLYREK